MSVANEPTDATAEKTQEPTPLAKKFALGTFFVLKPATDKSHWSFQRVPPTTKNIAKHVKSDSHL
jgi:hypothetical protein